MVYTFISDTIYQCLAFVVDKHLLHHLYIPAQHGTPLGLSSSDSYETSCSMSHMVPAKCKYQNISVGNWDFQDREGGEENVFITEIGLLFAF